MDVAAADQQYISRLTRLMWSASRGNSPSGVQRAHDVGDGAVAVHRGVRSAVVSRLAAQTGSSPHHALAEVDPDQVLLEEVVVNMYSAASARLIIQSASGGFTRNAIFCA